MIHELNDDSMIQLWFRGIQWQLNELKDDPTNSMVIWWIVEIQSIQSSFYALNVSPCFRIQDYGIHHLQLDMVMIQWGFGSPTMIASAHMCTCFNICICICICIYLNIYIYMYIYILIIGSPLLLAPCEAKQGMLGAKRRGSLLQTGHSKDQVLPVTQAKART